MAWYNFNLKRQKPKKNGSIDFPTRFQQLFLQRVGVVNSYDDNIRTYIEKGYQQNPVVFSIVNMIAKNVAKAKWVCKNSKGEVVENVLLKELMYKPNPLQRWSDLQEALTTHYMLEGNAFLTGEYGTGINSTKYNSLYVLPAEDMQIIAIDKAMGIRGYRVDFAWAEDTEIPATEVLHMRTPNPDYDEVDNWLFGQSPFRAASKSIQAYNESLDTGVWFLENKGAQKILFNDNDEMELGPEAADQLKRKLRDSAQGSKNSANIPIIDGKLGVLDVSANAEDALVLEQRMWAAQEICNVANFPSQLIGLKDATYQNAKEAKKALWENCVIPMLDELRNGYNCWLTPKFGDDIYLDYDVSHIDALQEDKLLRGEAITKFAGMVTINEAREMAGLKPIDTLGDFGGDDMYLGFVQAVVRDDEEVSDANGTNESQDAGSS